MDNEFETEFWSRSSTTTITLSAPAAKKTRVKKRIADDPDSDVAPPARKPRGPRKKTLDARKVAAAAAAFYIPESVLSEVDTTCNPYPDHAICLVEKGSNWQKVMFRSKDDNGNDVHEYLMFDQVAGYDATPLISASRFTSWHHITAKLPVDKPVDVIAIAHETRRGGSFLSYANASKYASSVPLVSDVFVRHLNKFIAGPFDIAPPYRNHQTFAKRRENLFSYQVNLPVAKRKDFSQFVQSIVFRDIEEWAVRVHEGHDAGDVFEHATADQIKELLLFLGEGGVARIENRTLREYLQRPTGGEKIKELDACDIVDGYGIGASAGTAVHAYFEHRLLDPEVNTEEIGRQKFNCREESDYVQAEEVIKYIHEHTESVQMELCVLSYRHKVCGSLDLLARLPDGTYQVMDYKRTAKWNDEAWFSVGEKHQSRRVQLSSVQLSGDLIKYAIQMAVYRKLCILNGYNMRPIANLLVVHPTLQTFHVIELHLNDKMCADTDDSHFHGIGSVFGEEAGKCLSPIEYVELMFVLREGQVKEWYETRF